MPKHMGASLNLQTASFASKIVKDPPMAEVNLSGQYVLASSPSESLDFVLNMNWLHTVCQNWLHFWKSNGASCTVHGT